MNFKDKRILVISPHPDDEVIAAGGLIARAKAEGGYVFVLIMATGTEKQYGSFSQHETRRAELGYAMNSLSIDDYELALDESYHLQIDTLPRKVLVDIIETKSKVSLAAVKPDIFIFPGASYNQDHNSVFEACITATRPYPQSLKDSPDIILLFSHFDESFWNTQASPQSTNFWVDISDHLSTKEQALKCYGSQMKQTNNHWRTIDNILMINKLCGKKVGVDAAEEYHCIRYLA
jgi:N-acetylglucosamine malate deacetylase 1